MARALGPARPCLWHNARIPSMHVAIFLIYIPTLRDSDSLSAICARPELKEQSHRRISLPLVRTQSRSQSRDSLKSFHLC